MKAHDLAQLLLRGPNLDVHTSYDYGDYWHTTATPSIEKIEYGEVKHSDRLGMDILIKEYEEQEGKKVLILN